jgi:hypothetical protein
MALRLSANKPNDSEKTETKLLPRRLETSFERRNEE